MKRLLVVLASLGIVGLLAAPGVSAQEGIFEGVCNEPGASNSPACQDTTGDDPLTGSDGLIIRIINVASVIGGIIAVIIIMWGGFTYITSGGDTGKTNEARNTILYAAIGLVVIVLAQSVISFILTRVL
jgi:hypothetical protein